MFLTSESGKTHGPLAGLAWEQVKLNGFSENSNSATAMSFGNQKRESLRSRFGGKVAAETVWSATLSLAR